MHCDPPSAMQHAVASPYNPSGVVKSSRQLDVQEYKFATISRHCPYRFQLYTPVGMLDCSNYMKAGVRTKAGLQGSPISGKGGQSTRRRLLARHTISPRLLAYGLLLCIGLKEKKKKKLLFGAVAFSYLACNTCPGSPPWPRALPADAELRRGVSSKLFRFFFFLPCLHVSTNKSTFALSGCVKAKFKADLGGRDLCCCVDDARRVS